MTSKTINDYRLIPRLLIAGYSYLIYDISYWFMQLDTPTNAQAGLVSTVFVASAGVFNFYVNTGNKDD